MKKEKQTKYEMVKEFYDLINNSYYLSIRDEDKEHKVYNSIIYEKRRKYYDRYGHDCEIFVTLSNGFKYASPHENMTGIYKETDCRCKTNECPIFDFINIYANELDYNVNNAIENVIFRTTICDICEERRLMGILDETGEQMYNGLLSMLKDIDAQMFKNEHNFMDYYD